MDFSKIYAKSDHYTTLEIHTQEVITAAKNLMKNLPLSSEEKAYYMPKLLRMAVLHDLGKIHPDFQKNLLENKRIAIRHELISFWFCENFLDLPIEEKFAIITHHKGVEIIGQDDYGRLNNANHLALLPTLVNYEMLTKSTLIEWLERFSIKIPLVEREDLINKISKQWRSRLTTRRQKMGFEHIGAQQESSVCRALLMAADHIGSAKMQTYIPQPKQIKIGDFQPRNGEHFFEFRDFQSKMLEVTESGILHSPTGSGKTEAALAWVYANQKENTRLFYLLPYTASSNAMVKRLQEVYGKHCVTPLHSKTLDYFYDEISDEPDNWKKHQRAKSKSLLSRELFYPVKVATMHQILKNTLKGKGWEFSLLEYKNALFIIDEFHTYNAFYTGLLLVSVKLLIRYFKAKVLFMSATIPKFMQTLILEKVFDNNPKLLFKPSLNSVSDREILDRKRHQLCCVNAKVSDDLELILAYLKHHSVLIIVNNVKTAQDLFESEVFNEIENKSLLHSGLHGRDRKIVERKIISKDLAERPQLLIATQAVEVSLDIDYGVAFIENAPIDALIQRFGRVNRAGKKFVKPLDDRKVYKDCKTVPVYLFKEIIGRVPFYDKQVLENTWSELSKLDDAQLSENDLVKVCDEVYKNGYSAEQQEDFDHGFSNEIINSFDKDWIAGDWNNWTEGMFENNQKVEMLCVNLKDEYDQLLEQKNYMEANRLLVQIYPHYLISQKPYKEYKGHSVWLGHDFEYIPMVGYKKIEQDNFL